jgi:hypothetical protein
VPEDRRGWVAIQAFGYWHLCMLLGIIALAAALALATIPLGLWLSALLQLTALVLVLAGSLAAEPAVLRPRGHQPRR